MAVHVRYSAIQIQGRRALLPFSSASLCGSLCLFLNFRIHNSSRGLSHSVATHTKDVAAGQHLWRWERSPRPPYFSHKAVNIINVRSGCKKSSQDSALEEEVDQGESILDQWINKNKNKIRVFPLMFGSGSFFLVLVNRTLSGIAPVADASSAQSRADVVALVLAATVVLTGLVWMSVKPKKITTVQLTGVDCFRLDKALPTKATEELIWVWEALRGATCCQSLVVVYQGCCIFQVGLAAEATHNDQEATIVNASRLVKGSLCQATWKSGKQNYLANLSLYPGRFELDFLPSNTQSVILQPLGEEGILIVAGDTVQGFGSVDQVADSVLLMAPGPNFWSLL